ncbi:dnaJ homolog subfamily C member 24 isoform X2 [Neomonachus schauinslandi]|uniref:DnaJ homolog subfamily C member 24 isoform X2 n=1 Tax=Neomonachus schauinslandi TaxID=29088 RepID=A0A2Y9GUS9_NEOSC|nr:dnaJ homolog subfamily C member 24 isoform X2 [Neomonachus schauinslandi]
MMAVEQIPKKDWYNILGADPSASVSDLKQKYQKLILMNSLCMDILPFIHSPVDRLYGSSLTIANKAYHPDKQSADVPAGTVEECIQKFIEIDQAWKILGNEETKKEYDLQRHEEDLRNMGPVDAQVYLEEMCWNEGGASENNHLSYESYIYCNHAEAGQPLNSATSWGQYHRQTY